MSMSEESTGLPSYSDPPLVEVVCSISFRALEAFQSPYIGLLWQRLQPGYPLCQDRPRVAGSLEVFEGQELQAELKITTKPQWPRVWFLSQDGSKVIQIQDDRIVHNWRKADHDSEYPRYHKIFKSFQKSLNALSSLLSEANMEPLTPTQFELTYVNRISLENEFCHGIEDIDKVFPDLAWERNRARILRNPSGFSWKSSFDLADQASRLYASINSGTFAAGSNKDLFFELAVRGIDKEKSLQGMEAWFNMAHREIVLGFSDLTSTLFQEEVWKRQVEEG